ncbi:hypothetical protein [Cellulomonas bogoriensis]|nr:hypothetical protein [Cellulomonas bogoriensis]
MTRRPVLTLTCAAVLALAACTTDPDIGEEFTPGPQDDMGEGLAEDSDPPLDEDPTADDGAAVDEDGQTAVPGAGPSPGPGECVTLTVEEDGLFAVADAGTMSVATTDEGLVLATTQPAGGWETRVVNDLGDTIEVVFQREGVILEVEAVQDGDEIAAELCR